MARFAIIDAGRVINHAEAESDFAELQGWIPSGESRIGDLWDGEVFTPAPPDPLPVPDSCTRRQGQRSLLEVGKLDEVEAAIAAISDPFQKRVAQVEYEAGTWERSNPFLMGMWSQLGGTDADLDDLFRKAVTF